MTYYNFLIYLERVRDTGLLEVDSDESIEDYEIEFHRHDNNFANMTVPTIEEIIKSRGMVSYLMNLLLDL